MNEKLWGRNTDLSLKNFPIGTEKMPKDLIFALLKLKKACAFANKEKERLEKDDADRIIEVIDDLLKQDFMQYFPLSVWQTGSGTQSNMNANEVIANLAGEHIHPNDHVNKGQSTNDVFPTTMQIMAVMMLRDELLPSLQELERALKQLIETQGDVIKTGRTHYQDATPISFGQEASAWLKMVQRSQEEIGRSLDLLSYLPIGGTAVGTGLNTVYGFDQLVCQNLSQEFSFPFKAEANKFYGLSTRDPMLYAHNALSVCASNLLKIGNDLRFLASGPRTGIAEIELPSNEAGSSIMPGKVNPTQIEALTMVAVQVMGNHQAILIANSQGHLELNVYLPLIAYNFWQSSRLLADAILSFTQRCVVGIKVNEKKMQSNLEKSLMTATALTEIFGYDKTREIVQEAHQSDRSIEEVVLDWGLMSKEDFRNQFDYSKMITPK